MGLKKMFPLLILIAVLVIGASFLPLILGSTDAGRSANISTDYQNQLNNTNDVSIVTISISRYVAPVLGMIFLCMAILYIGKKMK